MAKTSAAQLYVVVRDGMALGLKRIPVTAALQADLEAEFGQMRNALLADKQTVDFSPSYNPDRDELFQIEAFTGPSYLDGAVKAPTQFADLKLAFTSSAPVIKAVMLAIPPKGTESAEFMFQYFDRRRILNQERTFLYRKGIFERLSDPGVVLADHVDAVIRDGTLYFRSFHQTAQFLPLEGYFQQATDHDIVDFVGHKLFVGGKAVDVINTAADVTRRRISMVLKSGTLNEPAVTADSLKAAAKKFDIDLQLKGKPGKRRIEFPKDTSEVRVFLQLLAEGFYVGPITGEPYVANSYRRLKP